MTLFEFLVIVWAISAAIAWEVQAEGLKGWCKQRWSFITIGSLIPIYNTVVALGYVRNGITKLKR